ncbi:MAG: SH3 domain-containing protein [Oscillospiraceae bacterium]|nr:SH3 domain-containing protein [Oscillospiraceae bacterium]
MKRKLQKIFFLIIILSMTVSMMPSAQATAGTFVTTGDVNLRTEPSLDADVIVVVFNSSNVEVLEHNPAGWSMVKSGNSTGFIRSDFLRFPIGSSPATFRTTDGVNIRAAASTDSRVVSTAIAGTSVEVLEHNPAGWSSVRVGGNSGFIRSDFLTRGGNSGGTQASTGSSSSSSSSSSSDQVLATLRTAGAVNFRKEASTDSERIDTLSNGTSVEVLENLSNGWSRVRHNGTTGFIRSDLLTESTSQTVVVLKTTTLVRFRNGPSTDNSIIDTLAPNTSVEVLEQQSNGWSRVRHNGTTGFISSEFLSEAGAASGSVITTLKTTGDGVRLRAGPSTNHRIIRQLSVNTSVDVLEQLSSGWSRVRHNGSVGYISSDLLGSGGLRVELIDWSTARGIVPTGVNLRVVDVRSGISFNLRGFSKSGHLDVEPPTQADTDAILRTRNGVWAWAPRPVWVTVNDRTFAAALNGMPHDVSTIRNNGMNGHLCLHFNNTVTNSSSYQRNLNNAVVEAYDSRPR